MSTTNCDAVAFFDDFIEAFATFDGRVIAQRYHQPFVAVHADGTVETMHDEAETARYFQKLLDAYHADGCRSCSYKDLEVVRITQSAMMATLTWELYDANKSLLSSWRESYNIVLADSRMQVLSSIDHAA